MSKSLPVCEYTTMINDEYCDKYRPQLDKLKSKVKGPEKVFWDHVRAFPNCMNIFAPPLFVNGQLLTSNEVFREAANEYKQFCPNLGYDDRNEKTIKTFTDQLNQIRTSFLFIESYVSELTKVYGPKVKDEIYNHLKQHPNIISALSCGLAFRDADNSNVITSNIKKCDATKRKFAGNNFKSHPFFTFLDQLEGIGYVANLSTQACKYLMPEESASAKTVDQRISKMREIRDISIEQMIKMPKLTYSESKLTKLDSYDICEQSKSVDKSITLMKNVGTQNLERIL